MRMLFHSRSIAAGIMEKGRRRNFWVNLIQNKKFPKKKKEKLIFRRLGKWQTVSAYNNNMQQPLLQNTDASSAVALL
jgi:hypothetical protein